MDRFISVSQYLSLIVGLFFCAYGIRTVKKKEIVAAGEKRLGREAIRIGAYIVVFGLAMTTLSIYILVKSN